MKIHRITSRIKNQFFHRKRRNIPKGNINNKMTNIQFPEEPQHTQARNPETNHKKSILGCQKTFIVL